MTKWNRKKSSRKKTQFKPSHKDIQSALDDYLKRGGKITKLKPEDNSPKNHRPQNGLSDADEFLAGE